MARTRSFFLRLRLSRAFAQHGERLCCVLSSTSHMRQPASSPTHAHPLHRLSHQHSHQPSPHHPAMRTADGGQGWCSTCGTHSLRCVCDRAVGSFSVESVSDMRAQQHHSSTSRVAHSHRAADARWLPQAAMAIATRSQHLAHFHDPYRMRCPSTRRSGYASTMQLWRTRAAVTSSA